MAHTRRVTTSEAFTIDIPQAEVDDLRDRIARTRRAPVAVATDWSRGMPPSVLDTVLDHWGGAYDWRAAETRLNGYDQYTVDVDGLGVHVIRGGTPGATPLLLIHGWPDGFVRFEKAMPLLAGRFELVVPSIPGFAFSGKPDRALGPTGVADVFAALMTALGHERFGVHGADLGSQIAEQIATRHPGRVLGMHLGDVPLRRLRALAAGDPSAITDLDREWLDRLTA
jgi:pimeloyl-ACP methyl ester carboxylesterase